MEDPFLLSVISQANLNTLVFRVFWTEYCKKSSLFVIWVLFKVIWEIEKRSKFRQPCCQNSNKKGWGRREKWCDSGVRKELNFSNDVTKSLFGALDFCVYAPKVRPIKCLFRIFIEGNVDISNNQSTKLLVVESPTWHDPWANDGRYIGPVWYMCLKIENCCLKIFVEIRVGEKVHWNAWNVV